MKTNMHLEPFEQQFPSGPIYLLQITLRRLHSIMLGQYAAPPGGAQKRRLFHSTIFSLCCVANCGS